jgi:hypothetical protein
MVVANETVSEAVAHIKTVALPHLEKAKKYFSSAEEVEEKYEEAISAKEKSEAEGAEPSVIKAAQEHIEALKVNMDELGKKAAEDMAKARDAMEVIEEISFETSGSHAPSNGGDTPAGEL